MKLPTLWVVCACVATVAGVLVAWLLFGPAAPLPPPRTTPGDLLEAVTTSATPPKTVYPALYICHGAGPMPVLGDKRHAKMADTWKAHMRDIITKHGKPTAVAVVSAHYNTAEPSFGAAAKPEMYYDYGGFPEASYSLRYNASGAPALAMEMAAAVRKAGLTAQVEARRPLDHGVFVPLMIMLPDADVPVVPVSVLMSDSPEDHFRMGLALRPFRERGVFFLGSGSSMHHFKYMVFPGAGTTFGDALTDALRREPPAVDAGAEEPASRRADRLQAMLNVARMPGFPQAQPHGAHEHLMPLLTLLGTANATAASEVASIPFYLANVRHYLFEE